ncbi:MAG TPA: hypothetical protein VHR72_09345 [Gemmataceae bacterium]|nr:hypothetical protein [Gemmataceae bacterium]
MIDAEVVLVDSDVDPLISDGVVRVFSGGRERRVLVGRFDALPFGELSGTDVADAMFRAASLDDLVPASALSSAIRPEISGH